MPQRFHQGVNSGSETTLQKVKSLNCRWFKRSRENIEKLSNGNVIERDCVFENNENYYRILSVFKKSYGKWRNERNGKLSEKLLLHVQKLEFFHSAFNPIAEYHLMDSSSVGEYVGHSIDETN